jgi:protein gp37
MGVSVQNQDCTFRIDHLRIIGSITKFLSLEPLLGPLPNLNLSGIDWVIVGGESGPKSRPMNPSWVVDIRNQCQVATVPFFFKQWGGQNRKKTGRILEGETWDEMPTAKKSLVAGVGFEPTTFGLWDRRHFPLRI